MKIFKIVLLLALSVTPAITCADDIDCGYFNPAFGLCSTHSHNIAFLDGSTNLPTNPTSSEGTAQMNEVIGMKTTVIVQQMKQQYDTLNAMIKRFKTQLEKAVLTSKLEAITGNTSASTARASGGGFGGSSTSNTNGIAGAEECAYVASQDKIYDCLLNNLTLIRQTVETNVSAARNQLVNDMDVMQEITYEKNDKICTANTKDEEYKCNITKCDNISKYSGDKQDILNCVLVLNRRIGYAKDEHEKEVRRSYTGR